MNSLCKKLLDQQLQYFQLGHLEFEKEFDIQIPDDQAENIATVGQAISYIENS